MQEAAAGQRLLLSAAVLLLPFRPRTLSVVAVVLQDPVHHQHLGRLLADHAQADSVALMVCALHGAHRHQACTQQHTCEQGLHPLRPKALSILSERCCARN